MKKKKIVIGVTGGIAAYKVPNLASLLVKSGYDVHVCMTENAKKFITPLVFEAITHNPCVLRDDIEYFGEYNQHIRLGKDADLFVVVPATANTIGKLVSGIADNIVTEVALVCKCKKIVFPAMNTNMYESNILQKNLDRLNDIGFDYFEPDVGKLACNTFGIGRMKEVDEIFAIIQFYTKEEKDLIGKNILINAGATIEKIDPVRFITNHSTGKMGYELAKAAINRGAKVTLISGKTNLKIPKFLDEFILVETAQEMYEEVVIRYKKSDIIILSAAISDYTPINYSENKIKKTGNDINIECKKTKDILKYVGSNKFKNQKICGFAMETENLIDNAKIKLKKKNVDLIVANSLLEKGAGFACDTNIATLITESEIVRLPIMSKYELANLVIDKLV